MIPDKKHCYFDCPFVFLSTDCLKKIEKCDCPNCVRPISEHPVYKNKNGTGSQIHLF